MEAAGEEDRPRESENEEVQKCCPTWIFKTGERSPEAVEETRVLGLSALEKEIMTSPFLLVVTLPADGQVNLCGSPSEGLCEELSECL